MSDKKVKNPFVGVRRGSGSAFSALSLTDPEGFMNIQGFDPNAPKQNGMGLGLSGSIVGSLVPKDCGLMGGGTGSRRSSRPLVKAHSTNSNVSRRNSQNGLAGIGRMNTGTSSRR